MTDKSKSDSEVRGAAVDAEGSFRQSALRLETLLDTLDAGVVVHAGDTSILLSNPAASRILGLSGEQMRGKVAIDPAWSFVRKDGSPMPLEEYPVSLVITKREPLQQYMVGINKPGFEKPTWVLVDACPQFEGQDGELSQIVVTFVDITDRVEAEETVLELNRGLEQEVRQRTAELRRSNEDLERFAYSVSHDLRAPLRAISGFTSLLARDLGEALDSKKEQWLSMVQNGAQEMGQLIESLLGYSRLGRAEITRSCVDMGQLARKAWDLVAGGEQADAATVTFRPLPPAHGDETLLREVWTNLLSNAAKYSAEEQEPNIEVHGAEEGEEVVYWVRDNGVGFDMQHAEKVFGVFQRLHSPKQFQGVGVGLANVERIVLRHGGRVWAEGEPGEGATFYFALPAQDTPQ